ncbi:hypothetical protein BKA70DRAFT_1229531 [Coprinopsis sp. MPI-PUGE-AT-0042]|nr:hypothetical protein BKA70DRAFT_1229531 [Coprinopsis sp. MPI-PUGE-AT-0042]
MPTDICTLGFNYNLLKGLVKQAYNLSNDQSIYDLPWKFPDFDYSVRPRSKTFQLFLANDFTPREREYLALAGITTDEDLHRLEHWEACMQPMNDALAQFVHYVTQSAGRIAPVNGHLLPDQVREAHYRAPIKTWGETYLCIKQWDEVTAPGRPPRRRQEVVLRPVGSTNLSTKAAADLRAIMDLKWLGDGQGQDLASWLTQRLDPIFRQHFWRQCFGTSQAQMFSAMREKYFRNVMRDLHRQVYLVQTGEVEVRLQVYVWNQAPQARIPRQRFSSRVQYVPS